MISKIVSALWCRFSHTQPGGSTFGGGPQAGPQTWVLGKTDSPLPVMKLGQINDFGSILCSHTRRSPEVLIAFPMFGSVSLHSRSSLVYSQYSTLLFSLHSQCSPVHSQYSTLLFSLHSRCSPVHSQYSTVLFFTPFSVLTYP